MKESTSLAYGPERGPERIVNIAFAISFFFWAAMGLLTTGDAGSLVRWAIGTLHITAGCLILFRSAAKVFGSQLDLLLCIPAIISAGLVFNLSETSDQWPAGLSYMFLISTIWTILSLCSLGRSFAVFPSVRSIVARGPYRWLRHPAYLGELGMVIACVLASDWSVLGWMVAGSFVFCLLTIATRIIVEENLLRTELEYLDYCKMVRWRLIPLIW